MSFLLISPSFLPQPSLALQGFRLTCRQQVSRSHSHQKDTLRYYTVDDTGHHGREASTETGVDSPSRGLGLPASNLPHPSFLRGHCSRCHRPHLPFFPHNPLLRAFDTGVQESWGDRSIENLGSPVQGSLNRCHCVDKEREAHSLGERVGSGSQGLHSH